VIDFLLLWKEFILSFLPQLTGIGPLNALCESNEDLDTHGDAHGIFILDAIQSFTFFLS